MLGIDGAQYPPLAEETRPIAEKPEKPEKPEKVEKPTKEKADKVEKVVKEQPQKVERERTSDKPQRQKKAPIMFGDEEDHSVAIRATPKDPVSSNLLASPYVYPPFTEPCSFVFPQTERERVNSSYQTSSQAFCSKATLRSL